MRPYSTGQQVENMSEYAVDALHKDTPTPTQYTDGALPRATLPAKWWNWFTGKFTKNISQSSLAFEDIYGELLDAFNKAGVTPGVSGATSPQLHSVLSALFYAAANPADRYLTAGKTIDITKAWSEILFAATAGITISFPSVDAVSDPPYKQATIVNVSGGNITIALAGSGLSNVTLPTGATITVFCVRLAAGTYTWRHNWGYTALLDLATVARNADNLTSGTVADARIAATIARDSEVAAAVAAEATLARNADNLTSGTVADARIASTIARDTEVTAAVAAEAALARNADNLTSGTVADARIASTIARDTEVTAAISTHDGVANAHGAVSTATVSKIVVRDGSGRAAVVDPSAKADIATRGWVEKIFNRLTSFAVVRVATTADITLSAQQTIDGISLSLSDRVLVKNQSTPSQNGVWLVQSAGWTRAGDFDIDSEIVNKIIIVTEGTAGGGKAFMAVSDVIVVGTTAIDFYEVNMTPYAKADRLVLRDAAGRAKVVAPSAEDDIALKSNVTAVQTNLTTHEGNTTTAHGAVSAATANKIIIRDASGRAKVVAPSAEDDIALKSNVTTVQMNLTNHENNTTTAHGAVSAATANKIIIRDAAGRAKVVGGGASTDVAIMSDVTSAVSAEATLARSATNLTSGLVPLARLIGHVEILPSVLTSDADATLAALNIGETRIVSVSVRIQAGVSKLVRLPATGTYNWAYFGGTTTNITSDSAVGVSNAGFGTLATNLTYRYIVAYTRTA